MLLLFYLDDEISSWIVLFLLNQNFAFIFWTLTRSTVYCLTGILVVTIRPYFERFTTYQDSAGCGT